MPLIDYQPRESASPRAREILDRWEDEHGKRSLILESLAVHDQTMEAFIGFFRHAMDGGMLDRELKELVAYTVSEANSCEYCASSHRETLTAVLGISDDTAAAVSSGALEALPPRQRAVTELARQAALDPKRVDDKLLASLRAEGFDDSEIIELLGVVCLFQAANTYVDALNIFPSDIEA